MLWRESGWRLPSEEMSRTFWPLDLLSVCHLPFPSWFLWCPTMSLTDTEWTLGGRGCFLKGRMESLRIQKRAEDTFESLVGTVDAVGTLMRMSWALPLERETHVLPLCYMFIQTMVYSLWIPSITPGQGVYTCRPLTIQKGSEDNPTNAVYPLLSLEKWSFKK